MASLNKPGSPEHDSRPLMRTLAKLAGLEGTRCRKIVLVLECGCCPVLYAETYLLKSGTAQVTEEELRAGIQKAGGVMVQESDAPITVYCGPDADDVIDRMYICEKCGKVQRIEMGTGGIYCRLCGSEFCRKQRRRDLPLGG